MFLPSNVAHFVHILLLNWNVKSLPQNRRSVFSLFFRVLIVNYLLVFFFFISQLYFSELYILFFVSKTFITNCTLE